MSKNKEVIKWKLMTHLERPDWQEQHEFNSLDEVIAFLKTYKFKFVPIQSFKLTRINYGN